MTRSPILWIMPAFQLFQDCYGYFWVLLCFSGALSLRLKSLDVRSVVMLGEDVWMNCTLDLENEDLYSVKWYKDDDEFYRYLPRDNPSGQKYEVAGVFVDLEESTQGHVLLRNMSFQSDGIYKCEASGESPTFQTVSGERSVKVYVFPEEGPKIQGSQPRYEVGDRVNVTCISSPSRPPATLKWSINDNEAEDKFLVPYTNVDNDTEIQTTSLGLVFEVKDEHLSRGAMKLRCTATLFQSYSMTSEEFIIGDKSKDPPATPAAALQNVPIISGDRTHYQIGDQLDIKCSSSKSKPAPELQWYLNNDKVDDEHVVRYDTVKHPDGQETSSLGLRFRVEDKHFGQNNEMKLKCTATHSRVINTRSDEKTVGGNHKSSGFHVSENGSKVSSRNGYDSLQRHHLCTFLLLFTVVFA